MSEYSGWIGLYTSGFDASAFSTVQARIHDPRGLLSRQWHMDEFLHDGGATPIDVRVETVEAQPTRVLADNQGAEPYEVRLQRVPFESAVEREAIVIDG